ncbi:MAG: 1,6-anhydro-N-acetylmuramyl-L-alanine amidase AmpD [Betaproteobacteria bacterium]|nr:1,6-anhydro-N-acetylmuramyl-L-alanine amidase AmpD [Betaproteobacteria bacterium]
MRIDDDGLAQGARYIASPNCDARPAAMPVELIVIHGISLPPREFGGPGIIDLFLNRLRADAHPYYAGIAHLNVSAHFLIRRDGELMQFVPCTQRAWHAGMSQWRGRERCNDFSVGIELEGADDIAYEAAQYTCLNTLLSALRARYAVRAVVGHSDIAPGRKTDPGPAFDWTKIKYQLNQ